MAWANLGMVYFFQYGWVEQGNAALEKARSLAPENGVIEAIRGQMEARQAHHQAALIHFRRAVALDPGDVRLRYFLATALQQEGSARSYKEAQAQFEKILAAQPDNLVALMGMLDLACRNRDRKRARIALARLKTHALDWRENPFVNRYLRAVDAELAAHNRPLPAAEVGYLRNTLVRCRAYQRDGDALRSLPFTRFLRLKPPTFAASAPDVQQRFVEETSPGPREGRSWALARSLTLLPELPEWIAAQYPRKPQKESPPVLMLADGREVRFVDTAGRSTSLPFPGGNRAVAPTPEGLLALDFDRNYALDLALAGQGGVRLWRQSPSPAGRSAALSPVSVARFTDVTAAAHLPAAIVNSPYLGAWSADLESDSYLDIVLAPMQGTPVVLRNNDNGTWTPTHTFPAVREARAFAWADLDGDHANDAAFLDARGELFLFRNRDYNGFQRWETPPIGGKLRAMTVMDANRDGVLDLVVLRDDGAILRLSRKPQNRGWETEEIARWPEAPKDGSARLFCADFDNNGGMDLLATGSTGSVVWLSGEQATLSFHLSLPMQNLALTPPTRQGRIELTGLSIHGTPVALANQGTKPYHWAILRPRAPFLPDRPLPGERRYDYLFNAFGIGGEVEVRSGLLRQRQPIDGPSIHVGLGENSAVDAVRIVWPTGLERSEFRVETDRTTLLTLYLAG